MMSLLYEGIRQQTDHGFTRRRVIKFLRVRIPAPVDRPKDNRLDNEPRGDCDIRQLPHRSLADLAVQVLSQCGYQTASRALKPQAGKLRQILRRSVQ